MVIPAFLLYFDLLCFEDGNKVFGEDDIGERESSTEKWGYLAGCEAGNTARYSGDKELFLQMVRGVVDEIIHILLDIVHSTLHSGDSIALTRHADTFAPFGTKPVKGNSSGTTCMRLTDIAAQYKDLVGLQTGNASGGVASIIVCGRLFLLECFGNGGTDCLGIVQYLLIDFMVIKHIFFAYYLVETVANGSNCSKTVASYNHCG